MATKKELETQIHDQDALLRIRLIRIHELESQVDAVIEQLHTVIQKITAHRLTCTVEYEVVLEDYFEERVEAICAIRNEFGLSLVESKTLVDKIPVVLAAGTKAKMVALATRLRTEGLSIALHEVS